MKNFITAIITLLLMQGYAQEIKTEVDAINFLDKMPKNYFVKETTKRLDGLEVETFYSCEGYVIENEYLILFLRDINDNENKGKLTHLMLNLLDSLKMDKITKKNNDSYFAKYISYKNYKITCGCVNCDIEEETTKFIKNLRKECNENLDKLFTSFNTLKSNFNTSEKAEAKLIKFREEYTKSGRNNEITEEQRKFIVQANVANDAKDYLNALTLYRKAIDVNKFSYPNAYFNMALILAHSGYFYQATYAMKAYLILMPDAEDARKAQDKIYEWEMYIKY